MGRLTATTARVLVTLCAATRTTEFAARRVGVAPFLPALFTLRYANMGGIDPQVFARHLAGCRSFADDRWTRHWDAVALAHLDAAAGTLAPLGGPSADTLRGVLDDDGLGDSTVTRLRAAVAGAAPVLVEHGPQPSAAQVRRLAAALGHDPAGDSALAAVGLDELVKAVTYLQVSAFPGTGPRRMRAYHRSRRLFDVLATALAAALGIALEQVAVPVGGNVVRGYAVFPDSEGPVATVLATNGLEGTVQELLLPMLRYHDGDLGVVVMEMPGSYADTRPMSTESIAVYDAVLEHVAGHRRVDASRIGVVGVSFGGYWAAAMAAHSPRVRCAVACGAPTHHSFRPSLGLPQIILDALEKVTGATTPWGLLASLRALSLRDRYREITVPLLVVNGDRDTLLSTRDSVELAAGAPAGELLLYPDDDHCAMGHYREWLDHTQRWLSDRLAAGARP